MTNFEKRISNLTIDSLIELEEDVLECDVCYCLEYCLTRQQDKSTCMDVRRDWLLKEAE